MELPCFQRQLVAQLSPALSSLCIHSNQTSKHCTALFPSVIIVLISMYRNRFLYRTFVVREVVGRVAIQVEHRSADPKVIGIVLRGICLLSCAVENQ